MTKNPVDNRVLGQEGDAIAGGRIDLVISIPNPGRRVEFNSAYRLRRLAVDYSIPILTNLQAADLFVQALAAKKPADLEIKHWGVRLRRRI